jgi:hypothetical protein
MASPRVLEDMVPAAKPLLIPFVAEVTVFMPDAAAPTPTVLMTICTFSGGTPPVAAAGIAVFSHTYAN